MTVRKLTLAGMILLLCSFARAQGSFSVYSTPTVVATGSGPWIAIQDGYEYDLDFGALAATVPTAPSAALVTTSSGNCTAGTHVFKVTYVTAAGETTGSASSSSVNCDATHKQVTVTIPVSASPAVTGRNVYASATGTTTPLLLAVTAPVVANNTATTYTFNIADASLVATNPPSSDGTNTSAATQKIWLTNDNTIPAGTGIEATASPNSAITNPTPAAHAGFIVRTFRFFSVSVTSYTNGELVATYAKVKR